MTNEAVYLNKLKIYIEESIILLKLRIVRSSCSKLVEPKAAMNAV